jgi:hypothetical protein
MGVVFIVLDNVRIRRSGVLAIFSLVVGGMVVCDYGVWIYMLVCAYWL